MKLIISDLDGTLLNNDSVVSDYTKKTIRKLYNKGYMFAIATGRGYYSTRDIKKSIDVPMFMICNNGASVFDLDEKIFDKNMIPKNLVQDVVKLLMEYKVNFRVFNDQNFKYPIYGKKITHEHIKNYIGNAEDNYKNFDEAEKIIMVEENKEIYSEVKNKCIELFSEYLEIASSSEVCLDLNIKNCSKKTALEKILKHMNIDSKEVMAFGDSENDFAMLSFVGHPVAMKDSYMSTKENILNKSYFSNEENGVAKYIENYFDLGME